MKKTILLFMSGLLFLGACKKEETNTFTPTDVTGTTVVKGNISKNLIVPNGAGGWTTTGRAAAKGILVSVKINKNSLYPNSSAQGADVYSATSDNDGNYSVSVKTNASGVVAQITIDGFTSTLDTLINGNTKTGAAANFAGISFTNSLFMGQNFNYNYAFTGTNVGTNPVTINVGSALVTGSVGLSVVKEIMTGTLVSLTTAFVPLTNHKVYLNLNKDPLTLQQKTYEVLTDGSGTFSFDVKTVVQGSAGFTQAVNVWVNDMAGTRDTLKIGNVMKTGRPGVFTGITINLNGVYNGQIRNANYLNYTNFIPD